MPGYTVSLSNVTEIVEVEKYLLYFYTKLRLRRNNEGSNGCFTFPRGAFVPNTVFPILGSVCSITASPQNNPNNPCAGFVNALTGPRCGTGRDIQFSVGGC